MLKDFIKLSRPWSYEIRCKRYVNHLLSLLASCLIIFQSEPIAAPLEGFIDIKQTVADRRFKNLFIDEKFVYITDWRENSGTLLVVTHDGKKIQRFQLGDVLVDQLKRHGDAIYLVAREPIWIGKKPTTDYWERPSFIFMCRIADMCKMLRGEISACRQLLPILVESSHLSMSGEISVLLKD